MSEITRIQFAAVAVAVAMLAWAGGQALAPARPKPAPAAAIATTTSPPARTGRGERAAPEGEVTLTRAASPPMVVHVAGAVRHPGVYRLHSGDRVADAVARAGGRAHGADLDAINLATKVRDGVQIVVPRRVSGGGAAGSTGGSGPAAPASTVGGAGAPAGATTSAIIDLNTATAEQLDTLDGVGPATAAKILQYRAEHGPFRSVDDLEQISGIGPKRLATLRSRVRV